MALPDTACTNAKCPDGRAFQRFADSGGLRLEVTKAGSKLWRWKYGFAGREKLLTPGSYPATGLAAARKARDEARAKLEHGIDPGAARKEANAVVKRLEG